MDMTICIVASAAVGMLSYMAGRWHGYVDAQPKRDNTGRFKKKD
jgi:hypothetical protein